MITRGRIRPDPQLEVPDILSRMFDTNHHSCTVRLSATNES